MPASRLTGRVITLVLILVVQAPVASAQVVVARPADVATIEGMMTALYATVSRTRGEAFDWPRLKSLFHPSAVIMPQAIQARRTKPVHTPESMIEWFDQSWQGVIGTPRDSGFYERQVGITTMSYGDVAIVMSAYEKGFPGGRLLGRGINAMQLVRRENRWWILSLSWDEESTAGPVPNGMLGKEG